MKHSCVRVHNIYRWFALGGGGGEGVITPSTPDTPSHTHVILIFSRPPKGVRPRRSEEHLPSSKAVSRPSGGGAKKPTAPSSRGGGGGAGAKVIDSRGRAGGVAAGGGGVRKSTPSGGSKRPAGRDRVCNTIIHVYT